MLSRTGCLFPHLLKVTSALRTGLVVKQVEEHWCNPSLRAVPSVTEQSHFPEDSNTFWLLWVDPKEDVWPCLWRKQMMGTRGNTEILPILCASWVWRWRPTLTVHSGHGLLVNGTASGISFAKHTWGHFLHQFLLSARNFLLLVPTCVNKYLR